MPYIDIPTEVAEEVLVVMQEDLATEEDFEDHVFLPDQDEDDEDDSNQDFASS